MPTCDVSLSPSTARISLTVRRGTAFVETIVYQDANKQPIDIAGWQVALKSRETPPVIDWSTANGKIDLSDGNGVIKFDVTNAETLALPLGSGEIYLMMTDLLGNASVKLEGPYEIRNP